MSRVLDKARDALLTDPVTGERLEPVEIASLAAGVVVAALTIVAMIAVFMAVQP